MTSHAAVVARGMGRPCVSGSSEISIDYENKQFKSGGLIIKEGDTITIDGTSGEVILGTVKTVQPKISGYFSTIMNWSNRFKKLKIRTNAET
jgi:pyruvate,orthophosphate dikinase